jgi:hypothetical protein
MVTLHHRQAVLDKYQSQSKLIPYVKCATAKSLLSVEIEGEKTL